MATAAYSSLRTPIVSSAAPANPNNRKNPSAAHSNGWWAPLFGWSSEPDYITGGVRLESDRSVADRTERIGPDRSLFRGCFTMEKARELRRKTVESSTFHDVMYHSAIASRLASDGSGR